MYGTRDAAANLERVVEGTLAGMEIGVGKYNPSLCKHVSKEIRRPYHGDDSVILAEESDLQ